MCHQSKLTTPPPPPPPPYKHQLINTDKKKIERTVEQIETWFPSSLGVHACQLQNDEVLIELLTKKLKRNATIKIF